DGITFQPSGLINYLNCFPNLQQALSELDYRRFTLVLHHKEWYCGIELWAASEVVCKMPPLRRYLRLERHQRVLLLSVINMINQAMNQWLQQDTDAR
ncbi:DUF3156 family protein, partial [Salmonella enterica subsp. enterica serovar Enteritidis]|nr:DUF3156 family protein [Salmonella enterica subsp. enterica serovar Enteritidis]